MYDEANETGGAIQMLERSEMILHFSKSNTRTSVKMGDKMEMATILSREKNKGLILMTGFMGDLAITASYEELTSSEKSSKLELLTLTKEIQGYKCKKAKVRYENGAIVTYWYTEKIQFDKNGIENMHTSLPGTPLEYKIDSDGLIMTFTASSIASGIDMGKANPFSITPPASHKVMTYQEFEENGF